jgi:hypothetical protein
VRNSNSNAAAGKRGRVPCHEGSTLWPEVNRQGIQPGNESAMSATNNTHDKIPPFPRDLSSVRGGAISQVRDVV